MINGLFVTDLDGTLLNGRRLAAYDDLQAMHRLRGLGCTVVIATGRSNYSFNKLVESLGLVDCRASFPVDHVIFSTGAGIMDFQEGKILKSYSLGAEDVRDIAGYLDSQGLDYMIHNPIPETRKFSYRCHSGDNVDFQRRINMYRQFAEPLTSTPVNNCGGATEVLCIVSQQHGHQVAAQIRQALGRYSVIKATSPLDGKSVWIEIFAPGVSKSGAAEWLRRRLKISSNNVAAVGNDYNDVDLLQWAAAGFIVANAPEELKKQFDVVFSNENNGVAEAVDRWTMWLQREGKDLSPLQKRAM